MASKRMNVLVYSGNGTTVEAIRHCLFTLRRLLAPHYAVIPVSGDALIKEPWTGTCALLVIPGGADLPYCRTLNGEGNRRITQFVERGGAYLGFCAGGYYGSKRCEFEVGDKKMEVIGDRELAFYPGVCRGCAFPGFVYHSEVGARAVELRVEKDALGEGSIPAVFRSYYNGGGVFVDAPKYKGKGVEILASFTEDISVDPGEGAAAVVYCTIGEGGAVLTSPHPEFAPINLDKEADGPNFPQVVDDLTRDDKPRVDFVKACLTKLGLRVNQDDNAVPSLSRLHLSSMVPTETSGIVAGLQEIVSIRDGEEYIKDETDTFHLEKRNTWSLKSLASTLQGNESDKTDQSNAGEDRIVDYDTVVKRIVVHEKDYPESKETPYFNHKAFYANLKLYQEQLKEHGSEFGNYLLYGEVVTSTNSLLEKNTQMLRRLPSGFTATATVQVAGRGRGSNVWVSPAGSLMFSTCIRHPMSITPVAPVVFIQYLAALAIVEGVKSYDIGYQDMPLKLKWPNDIYAQDPTKPKEKAYVKIGGILVNSHYSSSEYLSVVGIGLNTTNASPTTSLNALISLLPTPHPPLFTLEKLLARILTTFSSLYVRFCRTGFDRQFEETYYRYWLHTDQIVTLEAEDGQRARIKGITRDWGLLMAEELGWEDRPTGKMWTLQSDSNSFDFFKGLLKRKV
ncbi:MAG: biotin-[acetyl- -carboxylase] ligase [Lasallia pustulata]|uniref:Biotin-[acetyl--carboxylase] ligase n=1 Tax=Lasallia pustulata TaxID=136370 RepID=A0A5M8PUS9_9LECA|nr:MAG: biotin-[acetyl- -carboxylase] ligase [Lasallia pustulata]